MDFRNEEQVAIIDVNSGGNQTCPEKKRCLWVDYSKNEYNAQKCYELRKTDNQGLLSFLKGNDTSADLTEDHGVLMDIMREIEETHQCSGGFCKEDSLPFYVFSNLNDGIPKSSCHQAVGEVVIGNMNEFLTGFLIPLVESAICANVYGITILVTLV
jgi:hypothetical protein